VTGFSDRIVLLNRMRREKDKKGWNPEETEFPANRIFWE